MQLAANSIILFALLDIITIYERSNILSALLDIEPDMKEVTYKVQLPII
jgi:hypothetical protein